jgi:RNA polymerase sigma factor (sigma-70 family)
MDSQDLNLQDIETRWSQVLEGAKTSGQEARNRLVVRYHQAIQRYVRAKLASDPAAADALVSDFALRLLQMDPFLRRADPKRGRFRHYLAVVLKRMVIDHLRGLGKGPQGLDGAHEPAAREGEPAGDDAEFLACWKQELVNLAWKALKETEKQSGKLFHTLVLFAQENPGLNSQQLAEKFNAQRTGPGDKKLTADNVRQVVKRGRELFGELLVKETARSLEADGDGPPSAAQVEEELIGLGLLNEYCKKALEKWQN